MSKRFVRHLETRQRLYEATARLDRHFEQQMNHGHRARTLPAA